jgi:hypothetical protein
MAQIMSVLAQVSKAVEAYDGFVERQAARAAKRSEFRDQILERAVAALLSAWKTPPV